MKASPLLLWPALLSLAACKDDSPVGCDTSADCSQANIPGTCLPSPTSTKMWCAFPDTSCASGGRWGILSGDGLASECVEPIDAGIADAGTLDGPVNDASTDGPMPDANPASPVVTGQSATLVLGQADFTTGTGDNTSPSNNVFSNPWGCAASGGQLWVADAVNARVLGWLAPPITNKQTADVLFGQFTSGSSSGLAQNRLAIGDLRLAVADDKIFVSDSANHRVMIWDPIPAVSGLSNAAIVLGQTSFTANSSGNTANKLSYPIGLWAGTYQNTKYLVVVDTSNNRVLIWNGYPTASGEAADVVIGQPDFGMGTAQPVGAASLSVPRDVFFDGQRLFVADNGSNRVLVWNGMPTTNGQPADFVIGQSSFANSSANAGGSGANAAGFSGPVGLLVTHNSLFVSDFGNRRVLVFTPVPIATGAQASAVLGQESLTDGTAPATPSAIRLGGPGGLCASGNTLWITDYDFHRVLRYALAN